MAKSINWPLAFLKDVETEPENQPFLALRLGSLYFDNQYWVPDEIVDIRANHQIIRQGKVLSAVRLSALKDLTTQELMQFKPTLQTVDAVIAFLQTTYEPEQPVTSETIVTLVEYANLALSPLEPI
jgi:hypothetical protein